MLDTELKELIETRLNRAKEILDYIPGYIDMGDYNGAINRSYYAAFHSVKAVELLDEFDSKKHSGVIAFFRKNYIKTGIFDTRLSEIIGTLQEAREDSDYNMTVVFDIEIAKEYYENAKYFVSEVEKYLADKI